MREKQEEEKIDVAIVVIAEAKDPDIILSGLDDREEIDTCPPHRHSRGLGTNGI